MSRQDEGDRPADRLAAAQLTVTAHKDRRRCINCPPEGPCRVEWWAVQQQAGGYTASDDQT